MNHWQFIQKKISQNKIVYLLTVIQHKGSSPGRQGFKMVVADDADIFGSIGGGIMEFNLVEQCKNLLKEPKPKAFAKHQIHKGKIVDGSGMICSGEQTVVFYPFSNSDLKLVTRIVNTLEKNNSGLLSVSPNTITFSTEKSSNSKYSYTYQNQTSWTYTEQLNQKNILYIVGGGHVGLATTKLLSQLGFYTVVFDNRTNLNTFEANNFADEKHIINYANLANYIPESNVTYITIMTNKYTDDKLALSKLLGKQYKFVGVLGSIAKLDLLFKVLVKEGFSKKELNAVHAPIGLKIHSQTPEEIAVSIAAQIIKLKNSTV